MFQRLTVFAALAFAMLISACASVTPARFQRGYIVSGHCLEQVVNESGEIRQIEVKDSPMEKLFTKYLDENPSSVLFVGFFFFQNDDGSGSGTGTADVVNRAAFLALDLPPARAVSIASDLRNCMLKNDFQRANEIFKDLAAESGVETQTERFPDSGGFKRYHEFKYNDRGEMVLHGLTRNFHRNGMIATECFFRDGKPEGEAREYNELGELLTGE